MSHRLNARTFASALLALSLAGCSIGRGPISGPEVDASVDRIVGAAITALAAAGQLGPGGNVAVVDHLDPTMIDRLPGSIRDRFPSGLDARPPDSLSETLRRTIERELTGRIVSFFPIEPAPRPPEDPACAAPEIAGTFIRLGMFVLLGGHGDAYLVAVEAGNYCNAARNWSAVLLRWEPGDVVGGEWVVDDITDDGIWLGQ